MKRTILLSGMLLCMTLTAVAQGNNTRMGGYDGDYQSLAERLTNLEKKNDAFNFYFNYAVSGHVAENEEGTWQTGFANKQFRLEIKGNLTDKIFYRLRHRMNRSNAAKGQDNFAKATDIMMVGYNLSDKLTVMGGKMCKIWGGYEFDENPVYIYQYSDIGDYIDSFTPGIILSYRPTPSQEIAVEVANANNGTFFEDQGDAPVVVGRELTDIRPLNGSNNPLTYIINWNGSFFNDMLQTRWAWGAETLARGKFSRMLTLGQKLNLPAFQWYFDYMGEWDAMDHLGIASADLMDKVPLPPDATNGYFSDVHYHSFITKANWQFYPQWNLMLKGTYETASVAHTELYKNYRKTYGYVGAIEYYPDKSQDFRVFLAYVGKKFDFSERCGLKDYNTNRLELGLIYRIKCF